MRCIYIYIGINIYIKISKDTTGYAQEENYAGDKNDEEKTETVMKCERKETRRK